MDKNKILITGGAGNVGGALAKRLVTNTNYNVVILDNLLTGSLEKLPSDKYENWRFLKVDVNDYQLLSKVMIEEKFDYVFHYAAVVGVQRTQENPISVLRDIDGIKHILELSKQTGVKRVFYSSSSEVYGEPVELPQNEHTTPLNSRVPYAVVKNVGECFFRSFSKVYGLDYTIFRFFNTYGPDQSTDFVVARFIAKAVKNKDIFIYGDGSQTRTFCYVDDNVDTCVKIFENNLVINDVINIGGAEELTILDLAKMVIEITKSSSEIKFLPALVEGDMSRRLPDNSKMKSILNRNLISIEEGIRRMLDDKDFLKKCAE